MEHTNKPSGKPQNYIPVIKNQTPTEQPKKNYITKAMSDFLSNITKNLNLKLYKDSSLTDFNEIISKF